MINKVKRILLLVVLMPMMSLAQKQTQNWPFLKEYKSDYRLKVAMPLGGIGTGTVSIGGRGQLRDWEVAGQGALDFTPVFNDHYATIRLAPFFAIRSATKDGKIEARLLEGPLANINLDGDWGNNKINSYLPRFKSNTFKAAYPLAQVQLEDDTMPLQVNIKAFNPLVPGNAEKSSYPVAILKYEVTNISNTKQDVTVVGVVPNFIGTDGWGGDTKQNVNTYKEGKNVRGIFMDTQRTDGLAGKIGTLSLTTTEKEHISYRTEWKADLNWNGSLIDFWDDFTDDGMLEERNENYQGAKPASLAVKATLAAGETKIFTFLLSWHYKQRVAWEGQPNMQHELIDNYYAKNYTNAWDVAEKAASQLKLLESETVQFVNALLDSDIPMPLKEAGLSNINILRSQTLFRDGDGFSFAWEGTGSVKGMDLNPKGGRSGWGYGSCNHVWNYEVTIPFLFGEVAMSMREAEFKYATADNGAMAHRLELPIKTAKQRYSTAADGQLGAIMKMYREWQLSGDSKKLKELYPYVKKALTFAWKDSKWDVDANGVLEGSHHNTMDVNYEGPNPQMGTWYLGALRAGEEMAKAMKDKKFAKQCRTMFESGSKWIDENLFNGEYYIQKLPKPINFQVGEGILVDQLVGQYMAHICGLGYLLNKEHIKTTLKTIKKYNFKNDFYGHMTMFRSYTANDEKGMIMGYYPEGKREARPFPYYGEVMTGFEYSTGAHMIYEGLLDEGLEVFDAIRNRYDGKKRNPYNEGEFGHRYGRAMASWSGILAFTGFEYNGVTKTMKFNAKEGTFFWSNGYAYGTIVVTKDNGKYEADLKVLSGEIELSKLVFKGANTIKINKN